MTLSYQVKGKCPKCLWFNQEKQKCLARRNLKGNWLCKYYTPASIKSKGKFSITIKKKGFTTYVYLDKKLLPAPIPRTTAPMYYLSYILSKLADSSEKIEIIDQTACKMLTAIFEFSRKYQKSKDLALLVLGFERYVSRNGPRIVRKA